MKNKLDSQLQLIELYTKTIFMGIIAFHLIIPVILSILFYEYTNRFDLMLYLSLNIALFAIRIILNQKLTVDYDVTNMNNIGTIVSIINFFIILTSFLNIYVFTQLFSSVNDVHIFFTVFILVVTASGAIITMGMVYSVFAVFIISNILPVSILFFYHGGETNNAVAVTLLIYLSILLRNGYKYYSTLKESIILKNDFKEKVKEATVNLEDKNNLLNVMLDASMTMIIFYDEKGDLISANKFAYERFGYKEENMVLGENIFKFVSEESIQKVKKSINDNNNLPYEVILQTKDSIKFPASVKGTNTVLNGENVRVTIMLDLTEIKEKDKLIHHQSKLAQMGEMINMIAHQWRQPLSAITATSIALNMQSKLGIVTDEKILKATDNIAEYSNHLSDTIEDFRNFFKPNNKVSQTNYEDILKTVLLITKESLMSKNIKVLLDLRSNDNFSGFSNEVKQVILNIIKNAEDALVENNVKNAFMQITTYTKDEDELKYILEIQDNAGGIPSEIMEKIFEPYFSTKLEKNGTGLGLYMSKMIIEEHCHGKLEIQNVKHGTLVRISLKAI